jgi:hypothetical protein
MLETTFKKQNTSTIITVIFMLRTQVKTRGKYKTTQTGNYLTINIGEALKELR